MAEAGWYEDPADASGLRFWDGTSWTTSTKPRPTPQAAPAPQAAPTPQAPAPAVAAPLQPAPLEPPPFQPAAQQPFVHQAVAAPAAVTPPLPSPEPPAPPMRSGPPADGGGAGWSWGGAPPAATQPPAHRWHSGPSFAPAAFSDRLGGLILDGFIVGLAQLPVVLETYGLLALIGSSSSVDPSSCTNWTTTASGQMLGTGCRPDNVALVYAVLAVYVIVMFWVWWRLVPGRMARQGASIGMGIAKLRIDDVEGDGIGRAQAFWRALVSSLLPMLLVLPFVFAVVGMAGGDTDDPPVTPIVVLALLGLVAYALPWLWFFWDRRHQTLYDKFSLTVVSGPDAPTEPWSVAALWCGVLAPLLIITGPLAVVFGNIAMRRHDDVRTPTRGRGAARAGQVLGWIATVSFLLGVAVVGIGALASA